MALFFLSDRYWYMINIALIEVLFACALIPLFALTLFLAVSAVIGVPILFLITSMFQYGEEISVALLIAYGIFKVYRLWKP